MLTGTRMSGPHSRREHGAGAARPDAPAPLAPRRLSSTMVGALVGLLALALSAIGVTLSMSRQLEGSAAALNDTGSLRMHVYRLALAAGSPGPAAPDAARVVQQVDTILVHLQRGDPQRPLFLPPRADIAQQFGQLGRLWREQLRPAALVLARPGALAASAAQAFQRRADAFAGRADTLVRLIEQDSERRMFWLRSSQLALLAMALSGGAIMIYLVFFLIIGPVTRLQAGLGRMKDKDFAVRLAVDSGNEFGQLAAGFNAMADRLQAVYGSLEELVRIKTATLEARNGELGLLYDSAAFLQRPQALDALCDGFLQRIADYFGADGGSVRVLDSGRGNMHLVAHRGLSAELVETERCLKVGDCLCGVAVRETQSVVHDLSKLDRAHEKLCHRDGFQTVSVFHIVAHEQHLGFFNLHFRTPKQFGKREHALLETLGQLLGIAVETPRLAAREREMAISEERNLVAQGLHDSIAQGLNYLNLQVQMLDSSLRDGRLDQVAEIVPALRTGVQESYEDVRELLLNFRSRLLEDDLLAALQGTADRFSRQTGVAVELKADVDGAPFPREQQLQLLFIVQEALSNIRKHALASRVQIRIEDGEDFRLTICDNGVGFDPGTLLARGDSHVGVHIMRERAQRIDATFALHSAPGAGTTVLLQLARAQRRAA